MLLPINKLYVIRDKDQISRSVIFISISGISLRARWYEIKGRHGAWEKKRPTINFNYYNY